MIGLASIHMALSQVIDCMVRILRFLLVLVSLFPMLCQAQSGQGGPSSPAFSPFQSQQAPAFGNQGCQPGFSAGPTGCIPVGQNRNVDIPPRGANSDESFERRPTDAQYQQRQALPGSPVRAELPTLEPTEFQRFIFQSTDSVQVR